MKTQFKLLKSKPGIIIIAILIILLQHWWFTAYPFEKIRYVTDKVTEYINVPVTEIVEKETFVDKLVYRDVETIKEVVRIDTTLIPVDKIREVIRTVIFVGGTFKDGRSTVKILHGSELLTFTFDQAPEGTTKIIPVDSGTVEIKSQRFGLFTAINAGYTVNQLHTVGLDLMYINKLWLLRDVRLGLQAGFKPKEDWDSNLGIHIGWQPFPAKNRLIITNEFYLWPERIYTVGMQIRMFKF